MQPILPDDPRVPEPGGPSAHDSIAVLLIILIIIGIIMIVL